MRHKYIPNKIRSSTVGQRRHILYTWQNWESGCMKTILQFYKGMKYCCVAFNICCWMASIALDGLGSPSLVHLLFSFQNGHRWQIIQDLLGTDQDNLDLANVNLMLELLVQKKKQLEAVRRFSYLNECCVIRSFFLLIPFPGSNILLVN